MDSEVLLYSTIDSTGDEGSFYNFPLDLIRSLPAPGAFEARVLPKFSTKGDLTRAVHQLCNWLLLNTLQYSGCILLCHSLGGLIAADALSRLSQFHPRPKILAILSYDSPFFGIQTHILSITAASNSVQWGSQVAHDSVSFLSQASSQAVATTTQVLAQTARGSSHLISKGSGWVYSGVSMVASYPFKKPFIQSESSSEKVFENLETSTSFSDSTLCISDDPDTQDLQSTKSDNTLDSTASHSASLESLDHLQHQKSNDAYTTHDSNNFDNLLEKNQSDNGKSNDANEQELCVNSKDEREEETKQQNTITSEISPNILYSTAQTIYSVGDSLSQGSWTLASKGVDILASGAQAALSLPQKTISSIYPFSSSGNEIMQPSNTTVQDSNVEVVVDQDDVLKVSEELETQSIEKTDHSQLYTEENEMPMQDILINEESLEEYNRVDNPKQPELLPLPPEDPWKPWIQAGVTTAALAVGVYYAGALGGVALTTRSVSKKVAVACAVSLADEARKHLQFLFPLWGESESSSRARVDLVLTSCHFRAFYVEMESQTFINLPPSDYSMYYIPVGSDCADVIGGHIHIFNRHANPGNYWLLVQDTVSEISRILNTCT